MRLVKLLDDYILDVDAIREVIFCSPSEDDTAEITIYFAARGEYTDFVGDKAISAWRRLCDLCEGGDRA